MTTLPTHERAARPPVRTRPPEQFGLPRGYRQQERALTHDSVASEADTAYWNDERISASGKWQKHVYLWAAELIAQRGLRSALDLGCGPATKLANHIAPVCADIEGADQASAIQVCRRLGRPGRFRVVDLESPEQEAWRSFDLVLCSDVIEHLLDPDHALRLMRRLCHQRSLVLISTPDRDRLRGRGCMESPKPEHVREWTQGEFTDFLVSRGWEVVECRMLPGDDAPMTECLAADALWRAGKTPTSPLRCTTVLCRPAPDAER